MPDNAAFLWQPPVTLAKNTAYDPASPINALTRVDGVLQAHDGRGNRTSAAGRTWRYDSRNMLVGANAPSMAATYGYYPEGGRAWKQVNSVTTLYLELDGIEWGSYDPAGTLKERTIRASGNGGAVVAVHSPTGGLIRLLPNRQGSVIGWLRPDGKLGGAYTYDAYGNSPQAGAAGPSFRYAGMRFDAETGLYHTPNRAYDPQDGRWMQLDPIGIKDGLNRYAYVKNSPSMGVDPTGLYVDQMGNWYPGTEVERGFDYNPLEHPVATGTMMALPVIAAVAPGAVPFVLNNAVRATQATAITGEVITGVSVTGGPIVGGVGKAVDAAADSKIFGPFHRVESPTQDAATAMKQQTSGEMWGRARQGSDIPQVQAYEGSLPIGEKGIEFTTRVAPDGNSMPVRWSGPREGVRVEDDFAKIDICVTKNTQC